MLKLLAVVTFLLLNISFGTSARYNNAVQGGSICSQPSGVVGFCKALFHRYTYDQSKGRCVPFNYGGCGGNSNNFDTMKECVQACG